jgi:N12 class adenine-specific DNA methylase
MTGNTGESWLQLEPASTPQGVVYVNEYFARHPERILGELVLAENGQYRKCEPVVVGALTAEILAKATSHFPTGSFLPREAQEQLPTPEPIDWTGIKDGGLFESDGRIWRRTGTSSEVISAAGSVAARIRGMVEVRDTALEVLRTQLEEVPEREILAARYRLNRDYDRLVAWFGPLSSKET